MDKERIKVLLIEDDPSDLYLIEKMLAQPLRGAGLAEGADNSFGLEHADNLSEGLDRLSKTGFAVVPQ